mmetsp:Transcript_27974/g.61660  ORF Transcript_27974/g.61660 Transcript_27974/m.61660 type:complete len:226 (+) Transcript_27974:781-1458(+)
MNRSINFPREVACGSTGTCRSSWESWGKPRRLSWASTTSRARNVPRKNTSCWIKAKTTCSNENRLLPEFSIRLHNLQVSMTSRHSSPVGMWVPFFAHRARSSQAGPYARGRSAKRRSMRSRHRVSDVQSAGTAVGSLGTLLRSTSREYKKKDSSSIDLAPSRTSTKYAMSGASMCLCADCTSCHARRWTTVVRPCLFVRKSQVQSERPFRGWSEASAFLSASSLN